MTSIQGLMSEINPQKMARGIELARQHKCHVSVIDRAEKIYQVRNGDGINYTVRFASLGRKRLASCTCIGFESGYICRHIASAAALHLALARQEGQQRPRLSSKPQPARPVRFSKPEPPSNGRISGIEL